MIHEVTQQYLYQSGFFIRPLLADYSSKVDISLLECKSDQTTEDRSAAHSDFFLFKKDIHRLNGNLLILDTWKLPDSSSPLFKTSAKASSFIEKQICKKKVLLKEISLIKEKYTSQDFYILLPTFPTNEIHRQQIQEALAGHGIQGAFSFRSILREICSMDIDQLQDPWAKTLQVLQIYDFLQTDQLELFH